MSVEDATPGTAMLDDLIARLQRIRRHVGNRKVLFGDDYDRVWGVGHVTLRRADERHIEWDETITEGDLVIEVQE